MSAPPRLEPFERDGVRIAPALAGAALVVAMSGTVEMRDPGAALNPYWDEVDDLAVRLGVARVEVDMSAVSYMNSSGLTTLVRWITKVRDRAGGNGYRMTFLFDEGVTWQRTNVPVLAKLAPDSVALGKAP
jgi:hypothetical protein